MYSKLFTCVLQGLNGYLIEVETDISIGLPTLNIVGLPDTSIKESRERVRTAINNSGFKFPLNRITINLSPANLKKEGTQLDLAIAIGILQAMGEINNLQEMETAILGELSLDGRINFIDGGLPMIISLREENIKKCIIPYDNKDECGIVEGIDIIPVRNLVDVVQYLNGEKEIKAFTTERTSSKNNNNFNYDFSEIKGQEGLKRAMEVAAAGAHNLLIIGPPGAGKTMAARRIPSILPELTYDEAIEITKIYSISGLLKDGQLVENRPFRSPHHTASSMSIIGGGRIPKPGEVSLSHNGVLFLDELPEFRKEVLEVLRQPLEDGFVTISRVSASLTYPSKFMLVASMNPCPCGYYGDPLHECSCTQSSIDKYLNKISNPLLDRIDIHIEVLPVKYSDLENRESSESSIVIRERVNKARYRQLDRFKDDGIFSNSQISAKFIGKYCYLSKEAEKIVRAAFKKYKFSARSYHKILKLSRTIADLDNEEAILDHHILEAIRYRSLDNKYWK